MKYFIYALCLFSSSISMAQDKQFDLSCPGTTTIHSAFGDYDGDPLNFTLHIDENLMVYCNNECAEIMKIHLIDGNHIWLDDVESIDRRTLIYHGRSQYVYDDGERKLGDIDANCSLFPFTGIKDTRPAPKI